MGEGGIEVVSKGGEGWGREGIEAGSGGDRSCEWRG